MQHLVPALRRTTHLPLTPSRRRAAALLLALAVVATAPAPPAQARRAPTLRVTNVRVAEGDEGMTRAVFLVRLRGRRDGAVTVRYRTRDRSAVAGEDYVAASGRLRFGRRATVRRVVVKVLGDLVHEDDERFALRLRRPRGARIGRAIGIATIADDDVATVDPTDSLVLNEVDYDQPGVDGAEFVEVRNTAGATVSLAGVSLHLVDGAGASSSARFDLSEAGALDAGAALVVASPGVTAAPGALVVPMPEGTSIQNGPDGLALVLAHADGCALVDALSYEGSLTAASLDGCTGTHDLVEGTPTPAADVNDLDGSLSRIPDGSDTDDAATDWTFTGTATPGAANAPPG